MLTLCTLFAPGVNFLQGVVNAMWWPLNTFFGSPIPSVAGFFNSVLQPILGCTV